PLPGREGGEVPAAGGGGIEQARRGVPGGRGEGRERVALAAHLRVDVLRVDLGVQAEGPDQALGLEDVGADGVPVGEGREELVDGGQGLSTRGPSTRGPLLRSVPRARGIRSLSPSATLRAAATPPGPPVAR